MPGNLKLRFDPARPQDTPSAESLEDGEQSWHHQDEPRPPFIVPRNDDPRNETKRPDHATRDASMAVQIWAEEIGHA